MPEGTAYVDMLIPLSETADEFTVFNSANGEKYGISEESEIAAYNQDGFMSYTFHRKTALSEIEPSVIVTDETTAVVIFHVADESENYEDEEFHSIEEFGEKYPKAKFAYIDKKGKILAVTNEIDIRKDGYFDIDIELEGEKATAEDEDNDDWIIPAFILVILFAPIILFFILVVLIISIFA